MSGRCKSGRYDLRSWFHFIPGLFLVCIAILSCREEIKENAQNSAAPPKDVYYCPMHPEVQQDHPGICPKPECKGMALVKREPKDIMNAVIQPANSSVLANVKTVRPEEKTMPVTIEAQGFIDYDDRTKHNISSLIDGRIEKLYVRYNYQLIQKGDKLFDIYSPELVTAQENLVYILNAGGEETELIHAAKQKLKILGLTNDQIVRLVTSRKVQMSIPVFSKWDGHIHEMENSKPGQGAPNGDMAMNNQNGAGNSIPTADQSNLHRTTQLSVKEGMYIRSGQTIFNVVDPQKVVVMLQIKPDDLAKIKVNQKVSLEIHETSKMAMEGKIDFIEPFLENGAKTVFARVDLDNYGHSHKVGTLVDGHITIDPVEGLWIPAQAVMDLGKDKIVWVKKDGHFIATKIETGIITKDWVEVYDGITKKDEIAAEAHYLTDSEGFVKIHSNDN